MVFFRFLDLILLVVSSTTIGWRDWMEWPSANGVFHLFFCFFVYFAGDLFAQDARRGVSAARLGQQSAIFALQVKKKL